MDATPIRVLLIEDNPADAELIQETLSEPGCVAFSLETAGQLGTTSVDQAAEVDRPQPVVSAVDHSQFAQSMARSWSRVCRLRPRRAVESRDGPRRIGCRVLHRFA